MQIILGLSIILGLLVIAGLCLNARNKYRKQRMFNVVRAKTADLNVNTISRVANYGIVLPQGGQSIDPKLWSEREEIIKNHIPLKMDNLDETQEYYKQAKGLLAKESGWSPSLDIKVSQTMLKQGYEAKKIIEAMKFISPCAAGVLDRDFLSYGIYIIEKVKGMPAENLHEKSIIYNTNDQVKNTLLSVKDLSPNPDSKSLFAAYAKEIVDKSGQGWTVDGNKLIVENMLRDGRSPQRIVEALRHSPIPVEHAYYFVKEIKNNPELQQVKNTGKSIG
jgi:hypothetical protein